MDLFGADTLFVFGDELNGSIYNNMVVANIYLIIHLNLMLFVHFLKKNGLKMLHTGEEWLTH